MAQAPTHRITTLVMEIWSGFTDWYMANVPADVRLAHARFTESEHCKALARDLRKVCDDYIIERMEWDLR